MKEYQALSPRLKVEFVDPVQSPARPRPTTCAARGRSWWSSAATSASGSATTPSRTSRTRSSRSRATGKKTVCFVEGEGERDIDDSRRRAATRRAKAALDEEPVRDEEGAAAARGHGARGLHGRWWWPGPRRDLLPPVVDAHARLREAAAARRWSWSSRELKEHDPQPRRAAQGVEPRGRARTWWWTSRAWASSSAPAELTPLAVEYPYHEITKDFRAADRLPHGAQREGRATATRRGRDRPGPGGDLGAVLGRDRPHAQGPVKFDEGKDQKGPVSLGAVATVRGPAPARATPTPSPARIALARARARGAQDARGPRGGVRRRRLREQRAARLPGQPGLLPEHGGLAGRGRRPDLDPPEGARGPARCS